MDRNNDKITSDQLYSVLTTLIIGIGILSLPRTLADKAGPDSLIVLIIGSLGFILLANLILRLIEKFPHSTIIEIGNSLFGKLVGKILGVGYFIYIFFLVTFEIRAVGEITKSFLLLTTPMEIIILTFLFAAIYTVRSGIETIARMSIIILPFSIIPALLVMFITLPEIDPTYFLPVLKTPPMNIVKATPEVGFSFMGFEFILFIAFFIKDPKNMKKASNISVITIAIIYFLTVFITIGRFGIEETKTLIWPTITLFKTIDIPGTLLENIEVVIMSTWLLSIFMTVVISYYGAVFLLSRVIESKEHNYLTVPLLPLIYFCSLIPENVVATYDLLGKYSYIGGTIFSVAIPILLLIISIFKKKPKKGMKKMYKKKMVFFILIMIISLLTGCWDTIEIDERAFITAIGWDKYEGDGEKQKDDKLVKNRYIMTITYPNVAIIAGKGEGDPSYVISTVCSTPFDGKQQINIKNNKNFYINHAKVVLVGKELGEDEKLMREILDVFQRNVYINRKIYFCYTPGKAKDILMTDTKRNMDVGLYIEELMEKEMISARRGRADFNQMVIDLRESNTAMIPQILDSKGELKVLGSAVLKGTKVIGTLNGIETRDVLILKGEANVVDYDIKLDDYILIVEQMGVDSKMKVYEKNGDKITINFDISAEGIILQHNFEADGKLMDVKYIEKINKEAEKQITDELKRTFEKIQKEYRADIFKVGEYLRKHEPETWKKIKDKWEEIYPEAEININFDMNIRRIGIEG